MVHFVGNRLLAGFAVILVLVSIFQDAAAMVRPDLSKASADALKKGWDSVFEREAELAPEKK